MRLFELTTEATVPRARDEVFAFFADAANLNQLTPPWLHFAILTPLPIEMRQGTLIDYRLRLRGMPVKWRTAITAWDPPHRFVDEQLRGPYRRWVHTHTFTPDGGGTHVADRVVYAVPGGAIVNRLLVDGELRRIFAYRRRALGDALGASAGLAPPDIRIRAIAA